LKKWFKEKWLKFKGWVIALLVSIGLLSVPLVLSAPTEFTYTPASEYEDGTPLPLSEIAETRLYCSLNGIGQEVLVASEASADGNFSVELEPGTWECVATHVGTNSLESSYSDPVTKVVLPSVPPNPPILNQ
jgi:hypothetical protein